MSTEDNASELDVLVDISLATLALIFGGKYLIYKIREHIADTNLEKLQGAVQVSISDLPLLGSLASLASLASDININKYANPLVVVRGMIKPLSSGSRPILSKQSGLEGVLLKKSETSRLDISRLDICNRWLSTLLLPRRTIQTIRRIPFVLVQNDTSDSPSVVINMDSRGSNFVDLTKVSSYLQPTITTIFGMKFPVVKKVEEEMLLLENEITAIGNLFISKDGVVEIRACRDILYFLDEENVDDVVLNLKWIKYRCTCRKTIYGSLLLGVVALILIIKNRQRLRRLYLLLKYSLLKRLKQQGTG